MTSLILSRLLHNVHTWVVSPKPLKTLNIVYMRVLRRIANQQRFNDQCEHSDVEVRQSLAQPSIDCLLQRKRLDYMARLVYVRPRALWAILQSKPANKQIPWTKQAINDLQCLYDNVADARNALPMPGQDPSAWFDFMLNRADNWHALVGQLFYVQSCLDRQAPTIPTIQLTFVCEICTSPRPAFCTAKALAQHKHIKHKMRNNIRCYIDDRGICPCCKNIGS